MRITSQPLPPGCIHLRLHPDETEDYTCHTIIKPTSATECDVIGFACDVVTLQMLRMVLKICTDSGFEYCSIERRKGGTSTRKRFRLG